MEGLNWTHKSGAAKKVHGFEQWISLLGCCWELQPTTALEPCEWLNKLLRIVWPNFIEPKLVQKLLSSLQVHLDAPWQHPLLLGSCYGLDPWTILESFFKTVILLDSAKGQLFMLPLPTCNSTKSLQKVSVFLSHVSQKVPWKSQQCPKKNAATQPPINSKWPVWPSVVCIGGGILQA